MATEVLELLSSTEVGAKELQGDLDAFLSLPEAHSDVREVADTTGTGAMAGPFPDSACPSAGSSRSGPSGPGGTGTRISSRLVTCTSLGRRVGCPMWTPARARIADGRAPAPGP